jgi:hypothetical protein
MSMRLLVCKENGECRSIPWMYQGKLCYTKPILVKWQFDCFNKHALLLVKQCWLDFKTMEQYQCSHITLKNIVEVYMTIDINTM